MSNFEKKRSLARDLLDSLNIKEIYYKMLRETVIIDKLKQAHSNTFFEHYSIIERWLDKTNTEYYCKINYQTFLSHLNALAVECETIYFGIALLDHKKEYLSDIRFKFVRFFSIYNISIDFRFKNKFEFKRKEIASVIVPQNPNGANNNNNNDNK